MTLSLRDCTFAGPALPEPFVKFELERQLAKLSPLPKGVGAEGRALQTQWDTFRSKLRTLGDSGGDLRVLHHVIEPLAPLLGYGEPRREEKVRTREGDEDAGWWLPGPDQAVGLRAWTVALGIDLDAPNRRGRAYRFSPARVAARVLLAKGERAGLLTDGHEVRLLLCDPARPDSHVAIALDRGAGWRGARNVPDSLRLLVALGRPTGVAALPEIVEAARLSQTTVTRKLREQARNAVRDFVQGVLDEPGNAGKLDAPDLAKTLWEEGLVLVYRLLFILKMESAADPSRAFSFAATSLWRNSYSPNTALAPAVGAALAGVDTGGFLEHSLRTLFRLFSDGLESVELKVSPLGGALFGSRTTPVLDDLAWGERAVAHLLDALLWTPGEKKTERERVHYGSLDVEDLGRVYEALLELEPGITAEPMCRLRRAKLEVVVRAVQGAPYRATAPANADADEEPEEEDDDDAPKKGKGKTKVAWVEDIPAGRFFLRTGLGRKSSGSYYTPHPFVRFLVQETLGPQVAERSPPSDPQPLRILALKVLDPAMGSGHFLVEACRFLGDALYEACRLCDERASTAEEGGNHALASELRKRVADLPDPNDELLEWLPSRAPEGTAGGLSQQRAQSLCRRLVAVHCLYGVDKNRLAVELAKLSLWLESYAEGLPLTFMDHRLVWGDSLTGPFLEHLFTWPKAGGPIGDDLFTLGLRERLSTGLALALTGVRDLTASVGKDVADLERKASAKARLDEALAPFRILAAAWVGVVMLGDQGDDSAYLRALKAVSFGSELSIDPILESMIRVGGSGVVYDLAFPEVFHLHGLERTGGFDAVVGNPPWDTVRPLTKEFFAAFDLRIMDAPSKRERDATEERLRENPDISSAFTAYESELRRCRRAAEGLSRWQSVEVGGRETGGDPDLAKFFAERAYCLARGVSGKVGMVLPAAFHAASGTTGLRRLFTDLGRLDYLLSFHNGYSLFPIETKVKFDLVVDTPGAGPTNAAKCRFRMSRLADLFDANSFLSVSRSFRERTGGEHATFIEVDSLATLETALRCLSNSTAFSDSNTFRGAEFGSECHATNDAFRLVDRGHHLEAGLDSRDPATLSDLTDRGLLVVANEDSIHAYDDHWTEAPRYLCPISSLNDRSGWQRAACHYRVAYRRIANIVDLRSLKATLIPPGWLSASPFVDRAPHATPNSRKLVGLALLNSICVDWNLRLRLTATLNLFLMRTLPIPSLSAEVFRFLSHSALRLTCNHAGYRSLWAEQLGGAWFEQTPPNTWPVLEADDSRPRVRAAIDAVVTEAYGLSREQYAHVLRGFSHRSNPKAPELCLAVFDELQSLGLDAFTKKHDPYHDIPLNEALPKPVIDFDSPSAPAPVGGLFEEAR